MSQIYLSHYIAPEEKHKYRDRTFTLDYILPNRNAYNSSFKSVTRNKRDFEENVTYIVLCLSYRNSDFKCLELENTTLSLKLQNSKIPTFYDKCLLRKEPLISMTKAELNRTRNILLI